MRFCNYEWTSRTYKTGDKPNRPTKVRQQVCTKDHGHKGEHESDDHTTTPNIKARERI